MQKIMFNDRYGLTKAVLDGKKTQTRRIAMRSAEDAQVLDELELKPEDKNIILYVIDKYSHYKIGETLAVALPYKQLKFYGVSLSEKTLLWTRHEIEPDESIRNSPGWNNKMFVKAEFMPHQIRITDIRLERLQDISDEDCIKEGIIEDNPGVQYSFPTEIGYCGQYPFDTPKAAYAALIDKVSGKGTWEKNPWVFVYDFQLVK